MMSMRIAEIIEDETLIAGSLSGATKADAIRELAETLTKRYRDIDCDRLVEVLWERERLGSTAIGDGIAIPHGKLPGIQRVVGAFGRHLEGVDFDSLDGKPTQLLFLLVAPDDSVGQHLKALARVSRLLKDPEFRGRLLAAGDRSELLRLMREEDDRL